MSLSNPDSFCKMDWTQLGALVQEIFLMNFSQHPSHQPLEHCQSTVCSCEVLHILTLRVSLGELICTSVCKCAFDETVKDERETCRALIGITSVTKAELSESGRNKKKKRQEEVVRTWWKIIEKINSLEVAVLRVEEKSLVTNGGTGEQIVWQKGHREKTSEVDLMEPTWRYITGGFSVCDRCLVKVIKSC